MTLKDDFPWYVVLFGYSVVVSLTYIVFLLAALACNKLLSAYKYERLFAEKENLATAVFRPHGAYFRVDQRNSGTQTTIFMESGLSGEFSTGKEIIEAELGWELIRSQVAQHVGISESDLESQEIGIYKRFMESPKWRISNSSTRSVDLIGNDSTDDLYLNAILRKIDSASPFKGALQPLEMKYQKQFPRLTQDRLAANTKPKALKAILLTAPFCIIMGIIFFRFMPFSWFPSLLATISFFLIMVLTGPFQMSLLAQTIGRIEFMKHKPDAFLYQDGVLQMNQRDDG